MYSTRTGSSAWSDTCLWLGVWMPVAIIVGFDLGLLALALWRPWVGLTLLLIGIPFNGFLGDVLSDVIGLPPAGRTALSGWHDALAIGVGLSALVHALRGRASTLGLVEWTAIAMLGMGLLAIAISPYRLTALYVYRTLYVPPVLALAMVLLWRAGTMPAALPDRLVRVIVGSGVVAALVAGVQVYVGGANYLNLYFRLPDGRLPAAYFSALVEQPRAFGPFHSPNEFGAYLALTIGLILGPGILSLRPAVRSWLLVPLGLALLLTLSRSSWVSTGVIVILTTLLAWPGRSALARRLAAVKTRSLWRAHGPPGAVFVAAAVLILVSSNAGSFISATLSGQEPSSAYRIQQLEDAFQDFLDPSVAPTTSSDPGASPTTGPGDPGLPAAARPRISLLGMGLGTVGPKSIRFGEPGSEPTFSSETWYVNYLMQVGIVGLGILALFVLAIVVRLWHSRHIPLVRAALAIGAGLAVGAFGIPVIDEPAVALPLWSVLGLGLLLSEQDRQRPTRAIGELPSADPAGDVAGVERGGNTLGGGTTRQRLQCLRRAGSLVA